ncbi:DUF120 domain-containing protein [Candidatus Woesearchaeota archaeon]|nr:DUF120 domain-containing protein [Candidatus Woesearchaeota archaeon]
MHGMRSPGMKDFDLLLFIAKKSGLYGKLESSTIRISREFGMTQQSISRKLSELKDKGMIKRYSSPSGVSVVLDRKGREFLQDRYRQMSSLFGRKSTAIKGKVIRGMGESRYYMNQKKYQDQFRKKLGFRAYPGTVNVTIDKDEAAGFMSALEPVHIAGFTTEERSFGAIKAYKIRFNSRQAAIIVPERTRYSRDVIEVIAPVNMRITPGTTVRLSI